MSGKKGSKKAFDFARNTMWTVDPLELRIIGGKKLPTEERGPLDTDDGEEHVLWDKRILEVLEEAFILNIKTHGVDTPILIAKIDGIATVIAGKSRVRAARAANKLRKSAGEPLIKIDCKVKRDGLVGLAGAIIRENEGRRDDDVLAKIEKLKRRMNQGVSLEDCAIDFNVGVSTLKGWLAYEDHAITATKKAVESGKISQTAGATLARIKEPEQQKKALEEMLANTSNGRTSRRAAQLASKNAGVARVTGITDKKTQRRLLEHLQNMSHPNASEKTMAFYEGAEEMAKLILGDDGVDPRLIGKLDELHALMKTEQRAKKERKARAKEAKESEEVATAL